MTPTGVEKGQAEDGPEDGNLYQRAGVDIDHAKTLLENVKTKLGRATRSEMLSSIGSFGGLFQLDISGYNQPVLVSSIDGVGTKLMVGQMADQCRGLGFDLVNHCINDVIVQGAEPLYFLDYLGIGHLEEGVYEAVLGGIADACREQHVALLGGETAEMPGMYGQHFDLVGCITAVVEKDRLITGNAVKEGDVLVGLASTGLHTNGYSLAREVLFGQCGFSVHQTVDDIGETLADALLHPHLCYWPAIRSVLAQCPDALHGMAHITGGGIYDNMARILPENLRARCKTDILPVPPVMRLIQDKGEVDAREMYRVFNMGVGMVLAVPQEYADEVIKGCSQAGFTAAGIGTIASRPEGGAAVTIEGIDD